jgi:hypothetical protein
VRRVLQPLSIVLHDHPNVAGKHCVGLRDEGLLG